VLPPTPPPDVDPDAWLASLEAIASRRPERLALIHFGVFDDVERHLGELRERLATWIGRAGEGLAEDEFVAAAKADLPPGEAEGYDRAMPFWQSYAGLVRYRDQQRA
jgi:hypothetical protein